MRGSFCSKSDFGLFDALRAEIFTGVRPWSGNWRPANDGQWKTPWRSGMGSEQVEDLEGNSLPAHNFVLRKLANLMNAEVQMWWTNFYEDGSVGCEFHHDGHAQGNVTIGASFGAARDLTFKHATSGREHAFLQENGDVFSFNEKVDCTYMHGVYPIDEKVGPRISVILFGKTRTERQISPEALETLRRLVQDACARPKERSKDARLKAGAASEDGSLEIGEAADAATTAGGSTTAESTDLVNPDDVAEALEPAETGKWDEESEASYLLAAAAVAWPAASSELAKILESAEAAQLAGFSNFVKQCEAVDIAALDELSLSDFFKRGRAGRPDALTADRPEAAKLNASVALAKALRLAKPASKAKQHEGGGGDAELPGSFLVSFPQASKQDKANDAAQLGVASGKLTELAKAMEALGPTRRATPAKPRKRPKTADAGARAKTEPASADKATPAASSSKPRPSSQPVGAEADSSAKGVGREVVGTWFTYNSRYIGTFEVREAPDGSVLLEQLLYTGKRLSGQLRADGEWLEAELSFKDGSRGGSVRLKLQPGKDGPAVLLMQSARWGGEVRAERSDGAYFVDNRLLQAPTEGLEYCSSRRLDDPEMPPRLAPWGTTVEGVDQGDGWLRIGHRGEDGRHFLPLVLRGLTVLVPRSRFWRAEPVNGVPVPIRTVADPDGPLTGMSLKHHEVFEIMCTHEGMEGELYLKLADGRGWVSSRNPSFGRCCVFHGFGPRPILPEVPHLPKPLEEQGVVVDEGAGDERDGARRRLERRRLEARARAAAQAQGERDQQHGAAGAEAAPPAEPPTDWTCTECGFDVAAAERVCSFCDTPRGEGFCAVALRS